MAGVWYGVSGGGVVDKTFGQMVRRLRDARRWTQEKLAEEAGLDQTTVSNTERDKGQPTLLTVMKLATVFDADPYGWAVRTGHFPAPPPSAGPPPESTLWPDSPHLTVAQMVEDIENRKGAWYRAELTEARETLSRADYEDFCVQLWRMFEGNTLMAFGNLKRGR